MRNPAEGSHSATQTPFLTIVGLSMLAIAGAFAASLRAQDQATPTANPSPLKFDAVSIKVNKSGSQVQMLPLWRPGGHVTATNTTLRFLVVMAYDLPFFPRQTRATIVDVPNWIDSEHFDIEAETEGNSSEAEKRIMIQSLLSDRFKLTVHHETRQLPVFALVLANATKKGPPLQPHREDTKCFALSSGPPSTSGSDGGAPPTPCGAFGVMAGPPVSISGANVTMQQLAKTLSYLQGIDRSVVDRTGLSGSFDVRLNWTPEPSATSEADAAAPPFIFTAIKQQLGLKLKSARGPVDVLVIDHVEQPSEN